MTNATPESGDGAEIISAKVPKSLRISIDADARFRLISRSDWIREVILTKLSTRSPAARSDTFGVAESLG